MRKKIIVTVVLAAGFVLGNTVGAAERPPMAQLCGGCHKPEPGVMMGFLDNISLKSRMIQMDFMSHKDTVKFTDSTKVRNVSSFEDIRNYRGKGFQINYLEENGERKATEIIRFDIMKAIGDDEKIAREEFKKLRAQPGVVVYDVRPPVPYQMAHVPGAQTLPAPAFEKFSSRLPQEKNTPIILYGVGGCLSPTVAMKVKSLGYTDVKIYTGGYPDWAQGEYGSTAPDWLRMAIEKEIPHVLIDVRSNADMSAGHIKGAVNLPLPALAESRHRFPDNRMAPIIFYGPGSEKAAETAVAWGYKKVQVLPVSFEKWQADGFPVQTGQGPAAISYVPKPKPGTVGVAEFEKMAAGQQAGVALVDVRNPEEFAQGSVPGAVNLPVEQMEQRLAELPSDKELILFCNTGVQAEMAQSILNKKGRANRYLDGKVTVQEGQLKVEEQ
ncbi:rhodanese-like domain-containing protein [Thiovibrio sp. JS02]